MQVIGVVLMARALEDVDLIEYQVEPIITSVLGESVVSAVYFDGDKKWNKGICRPYIFWQSELKTKKVSFCDAILLNIL